MAKYEVTTDLLVSVRVKVLVEAHDAEGAIEAALEQMPGPYDPERSAEWKASIMLKPPKDVTIVGKPRPHHFSSATGAEKAKKVAS